MTGQPPDASAWALGVMLARLGYWMSYSAKERSMTCWRRIPDEFPAQFGAFVCSCNEAMAALADGIALRRYLHPE